MNVFWGNTGSGAPGPLEKWGNGLIRKYQEHVSDDLADERDHHCPYTPSCSHYTQDAIAEYGLLEGGVMGFMRMMRCHHTAQGGYDPVIHKDGTGLPDDFLPAHRHFVYETAERIMAYGDKPAGSPPASLEPEKPREEKPLRPGALQRAVTVACAAAGGAVAGLGFAVIGAGLGAWLGTEAGLDRVDAVNAKIAEKYSPESVYGFGKIENAVGKPAYRLHQRILHETGRETCANVVGALVGGPLGLVLGAGKGLVKGFQMGSQFGGLFGRSISGNHAPRSASVPQPRGAAVPEPGIASAPETRSAAVAEPGIASAPETRSAAVAEPGIASAPQPRGVSAPASLASPVLEGRPAFDVGGTRLAPLFHEDIATAMEELIRGAKTSVDVEMFSIESPTMVALLKDRLSQGVRVRIINTPLGRNAQEREAHRQAVSELEARGAEVLEYPVLKSLWQFNHTKLLVVDDHAAIVGSKNWSDDGRLQHDFDVGVLVTGDTVDEARSIMSRDWSLSGGEGPAVAHHDASPNVSLEVNEPFHHDAAKDVRNSIREATSSIDVGMYWLTDRRVIEELSCAVAERGVRVRVLLSQNDENRATKEALESAGIEVRVFTPPLGPPDERPTYHAKMAVFDSEKVILGSCDWTTQAFYLNHELNLSVRDQALAAHMTQSFEKDWQNCAAPDGPFDPAFPMQGMARLNVLGREVSHHLPACLAEAGMMTVGAASVVKRAFV